MVWLNMNDVLRADTEAQTDWAFIHVPIKSMKPPRVWRAPSTPVPHDVGERQEGELASEQALRLRRLGYATCAVAAFMGISASRIHQLVREERVRIGIISS